MPRVQPHPWGQGSAGCAAAIGKAPTTPSTTPTSKPPLWVVAGSHEEGVGRAECGQQERGQPAERPAALRPQCAQTYSHALWPPSSSGPTSGCKSCTASPRGSTSGRTRQCRGTGGGGRGHQGARGAPRPRRPPPHWRARHGPCASTPMPACGALSSGGTRAMSATALAAAPANWFPRPAQSPWASKYAGTHAAPAPLVPAGPFQERHRARPPL